jgi:hypothetical protein
MHSCTCIHVHVVFFCAGARTTSAPSSTPAAPFVTTCPSGSKWSPSQQPVTHARSSSRAFLNRWQPGHHTACLTAAAAGASVSARSTPTVLRGSSACRRWRSQSSRRASIRGSCRRVEGGADMCVQCTSCMTAALCSAAVWFAGCWQ